MALFIVRAVPGKKVLGWGVEQNQHHFFFFYGTVYIDIPGNTPHPQNLN